MKKAGSIQSFHSQMRESMQEINDLMTRGESPAGDGRFIAKTVDAAEPVLDSSSSFFTSRTQNPSPRNPLKTPRLTIGNKWARLLCVT